MKEIDKNQDESNGSSGSTENSSSSFSSQDKHYSSRVPRVPLEVFQEEMTKRAASSSRASSSKRVESSKTPS